MPIPEMTEKQKKKQEINRRFRERQKAKQTGQPDPYASDVSKKEDEQATADLGVKEWAEPLPNFDSSDPSAGAKSKVKPKTKRAKAVYGPEGRPPRGPGKKNRPRVKKVKVPYVSQLDAAYVALSKAPAPLSIPDLLAAIKKGGLWKSENGKTPGATLSAALIREIAKKGSDSRFRKTAPGRYAAVIRGE